MENDRLILCREALKALKDSTMLLTVAESLLKVGNHREASRLRREARARRNLSVRLMEKANINQRARPVPNPERPEDQVRAA